MWSLILLAAVTSVVAVCTCPKPNDCQYMVSPYNQSGCQCAYNNKTDYIGCTFDNSTSGDAAKGVCEKGLCKKPCSTHLADKCTLSTGVHDGKIVHAVCFADGGIGTCYDVFVGAHGSTGCSFAAASSNTSCTLGQAFTGSSNNLLPAANLSTGSCGVDPTNGLPCCMTSGNTCALPWVAGSVVNQGLSCNQRKSVCEKPLGSRTVLSDLRMSTQSSTGRICENDEIGGCAGECSYQFEEFGTPCVQSGSTGYCSEGVCKATPAADPCGSSLSCNPAGGTGSCVYGPDKQYRNFLEDESQTSITLANGNAYKSIMDSSITYGDILCASCNCAITSTVPTCSAVNKCALNSAAWTTLKPIVGGLSQEIRASNALAQADLFPYISSSTSIFNPDAASSSAYTIFYDYPEAVGAMGDLAPCPSVPLDSCIRAQAVGRTGTCTSTEFADDGASCHTATQIGTCLAGACKPLSSGASFASQLTDSSCIVDGQPLEGKIHVDKNKIPFVYFDRTQCKCAANEDKEHRPKVVMKVHLGFNSCMPHGVHSVLMASSPGAGWDQFDIRCGACVQKPKPGGGFSSSSIVTVDLREGSYTPKRSVALLLKNLQLYAQNNNNLLVSVEAVAMFGDQEPEAKRSGNDGLYIGLMLLLFFLFAGIVVAVCKRKPSLPDRGGFTPMSRRPSLLDRVPSAAAVPDRGGLMSRRSSLLERSQVPSSDSGVTVA